MEAMGKQNQRKTHAQKQYIFFMKGKKMIETNYLSNRIIFNENIETWICDELGLSDKSLSNLKIKIDKRIEANKRQEKQKVKPVDCFYFGYSTTPTTIKATSITTGYQYNHSGLAVWGNVKDGRTKKDIDDIYKKDEIIEKLIEAKDDIDKKIDQWRKENRYTPKELIKEMGYSAEYSKSVFGIDLEED